MNVCVLGVRHGKFCKNTKKKSTKPEARLAPGKCTVSTNGWRCLHFTVEYIQLCCSFVQPGPNPCVGADIPRLLPRPCIKFEEERGKIVTIGIFVQLYNSSIHSSNCFYTPKHQTIVSMHCFLFGLIYSSQAFKVL